MKFLKLMCFIIPAIFVTEQTFADGLWHYREGDYVKAQTELLKNEYSKNAMANYYLGKMYLYGYGHLKNNNLALKYLEKSAELGYLPAQNIMARYYLLVANDKEKALKWFKQAADQGDLDAQLYTAAAYMFGVGTRSNSDVARRYHIMAARQGNGISQYALAEHFLDSKQAQNKKLGLIWLNKAVETGNLDAKLKLAQLYAKGYLVTKDLNKARELIAQNNDNPKALYVAGEIAKNSNDLIQAKDLFLKAANANDVEAQYQLYQLFSQKDSPFRDTTEAVNWLTKAAENNLKIAQSTLAKVYSDGVLVTKDENLAKLWNQKAKANEQEKNNESKASLWLSAGKYQKLSDCGYKLTGIFTNWHNKNMLQENNYNQHPQMNVVTKEMLFKPKFVMMTPNEIPISEYYDALATTLTKDNSKEHDFPDYPLTKVLKVQNNNISQIPEIKSDNEENDNESKTLHPVVSQAKLEYFTPGSKEEIATLDKQAALGNADAQFSLAQRYQNGIGVKKDVEEAIKYYTLAAMQKDLRAEYSLAILYLKEADYQQAFVWLNDAAFKGNSYAQFALAKINETGFNDDSGNPVVKPNKEQSLAMYTLAASSNFGPAQYNLAEILVRSKPENLSESAKRERTELIKNLYNGALTSGIKEASLPLAFFKAADKDSQKHLEAFKFANDEAQNGNKNAALLLGLLYDRGVGVQQNRSQAISWYQKAPVNPISSFILGTYYYSGQNITQDKEKGLELLKQSQNGDFSYASLNLAIAKHENHEEFISDLENALENGNPKAGILMADYFVSLNNDEDKLNQAVDIYRKFAQVGDRDAQTKLGFMYEFGLGVSENLGNAQTWYSLASNQNQNVAQFLLGRLHQLGKVDKEPDYNKAKNLYEKSANHFSPAAVALGFIYDTVDDNYDLARYYYQMAANQRNVIGEYNLGLIYEQGKGIEPNLKYAQKIYKNAAQKNHIKATVQLAGLYLTGVDGDQNEKEAINLYQKASNAGDRDAQYQLGLLLETGYGLKLDYQNAHSFYVAAKNRGNAKATLALARMYQYGLGIPVDQNLAAQYYKELAALNHPYAQYQLAMQFTTEEKDRRHYLEQALQNGSIEASKVLKVLNSKNKNMISFVEPMKLNNKDIEKKPVDRMYMEALNTFNNGNETESLIMLDSIRNKYPKFQPAKQIYEQINQTIKNGFTSIAEGKYRT